MTHLFPSRRSSELNFYGGFVTDGGTGANTLGLRNQGPSRTLVLLNGRRLAPGGTRGSVLAADLNVLPTAIVRSEEHTSELQSLMRSSYAVFCLKKKKQQQCSSYPATSSLQQ